MSAPHRRRELWLADDSPTDLQHAALILSPFYALRSFKDGSTLLEALSSTRKLPDAIVSDWLMAGVSGVEVCRFLQAQPPPLGDVPVLLLTAQNEVGQLVEGLESGASDFLSKPYAEAELRARVGVLIRTRELLERAEAAEADVRRVLSNAPDAMATVDANGVITFANEELIRITGRTAEELVGKPLHTIIPTFPTQHLSAGYGESMLPPPDVIVGGRVLSPSMRMLSTDSASSTTVALRDVTERRHAEARRLDFYSIIAHDLRTPLSAMLLRNDLIMRGKHGVLRPELVSDLKKLGTSMRSLVTMINDFLELARLEGVGFKLDTRPLDLAALLRTTCEDFRPLLETSDLEWQDLTPDGHAWVNADPQRISQVITNLFGNALKFTPPGGRITTRVRTIDSQVEVEVQDTGPGIPDELLPRLFERYSRAIESQQVAGSGLGLMIVRELIEAHKGEVGVESRPGEGSRFWFRLPRAPPQGAP